MEFTMVLFGAIIVLGIMLFIAEPLRFIPEIEKKVKKVGSTYWGVYEGAPLEETEGAKTVELKDPARKQQIAYGSITYSQGRGVSMNGRK